SHHALAYRHRHGGGPRSRRARTNRKGLPLPPAVHGRGGTRADQPKRYPGPRRLMPTRLETAERHLLDALAGAHERGWRLVDIKHGYRKLPGFRVDVLGHLDGGLEAWRRACVYSDEHAATMVESLARFIDRLPHTIKVSETTRSAVDDALHRRGRGLLAKAESTEYGPEADALLAKAHELMARHSIDRGDVDGPR